MKLTKRRLKEIIKEELEEAGRYRSRRSGYQRSQQDRYDEPQYGEPKKRRPIEVAQDVLRNNENATDEEIRAEIRKNEKYKDKKDAYLNAIIKQAKRNLSIKENTSKLSQDALSAMIKEMLDDMSVNSSEVDRTSLRDPGAPV